MQFKAASAASGAVALTLAELLPESPKTNRHFKTMYRILIGLMSFLAASHWLMGEIGGQILDYFCAINILAFGIGMITLLCTWLVSSMCNWEEAVHRKRNRSRETNERG